jgi:hypothetical protein
METKNRCVLSVILKLLEIIPKNETKLINEIEEYAKSCFNKPPELRTAAYCWLPLQKIMNDNITEVDEEWKQETVQLFNENIF